MSKKSVKQPLKKENTNKPGFLDPNRNPGFMIYTLFQFLLLTAVIIDISSEFSVIVLLFSLVMLLWSVSLKNTKNKYINVVCYLFIIVFQIVDLVIAFA